MRIQPASIHTIAHPSLEVAEGGDAREEDTKTRLFTEVTSPDSHSPAVLSARSPQHPGMPLKTSSQDQNLKANLSSSTLMYVAVFFNSLRGLYH